MHALLRFKRTTDVSLPLMLCRVQAGFPSPADDYVEQALDLNEHLIRNPPATYFVRASGDSMEGAGIRSGDLLVVDRSIDPCPGLIVIASVQGEYTVKTLERRAGRLWLAPANPRYTAIEVTPDSDLEIWGVVTHVIHRTMPEGGHARVRPG
ncbi:MAG: translesion error-prone DNA polymerase V autoproteolytic subunit [Desulfocurvibacter africanus]